jgi:hypothetical protein
MIKYNFNFTISKATGIVLIFGGIALGFYLKSESVAISLVGFGSALITVKTITQGKEK